MRSPRITRRQLLKYGAAAGVATMFTYRWASTPPPAYAAYINSPQLRKFAQPLRGVGDIPIATPDSSPAPVTGVTHYTIDMVPFHDQLCPTTGEGGTVLGTTKLWGYNPAPNGTPDSSPRHLGGIIVAERGHPIQITFRNKLTLPHPIPVDRTVMGNTPEADNDVRAAIHLHGGFVPWTSDGGPFHWFDPAGGYGASVVYDGGDNVYKILNPDLENGECEIYIPNDQSARMMWYHDHAWGLTRINAYAGLASAYILRDEFEEDLVGPAGLPEFIEEGGQFELPLVIQDKIFVSEGMVDPTWTGEMAPGSLWYFHTYDPKVFKLTGNRVSSSLTNLTPPDPSCVPEFFGDTMLANGTVYPEATVQARRYRIRLLNACNARFLNLQLYVEDTSADGITLNPLTLAPTNAAGPSFTVIGTESGFLPAPVVVPSNVPFNPATFKGSLIAAPAERYDLLVDFKNYAGKKIILYNDAPAPFPGGAPNFDYFPGNPLNPVQPVPGFGPNTRQIMRFNVVAADDSDADQPLSLDLQGGNEDLLAPLGTGLLPVLAKKTPVRRLTLSEGFDAYGRLVQMMGTDVPLVNSQLGRAYLDPATEVVQLNGASGLVEVWQIANLTADTHPIHFHIVDVQIVSRQRFKSAGFPSATQLVGAPIPPDPEEAGWKETVRMNPGEVTTVIMKFRLPRVLKSDDTEIPVPSSPRMGKAGLGTNRKLPTVYEYVWHCHILEHEEHDMMRPLVIVP